MLLFSTAAAVFFDTNGNLMRSAAPSLPRHNAAFLPTYKGLSLVETTENGKFQAVLLDDQQARKILEDNHDAIPACLGKAKPGSDMQARLTSDQSLWMLDLSHMENPADPESLGAPKNAQWKTIRSGAGGYDILQGLNDDDEGALLSTARGLALWHRKVTFCSVCGSPTESRRNGRLRQCTSEACGERFRPRLDTSIIVLVTHGDLCLLGRNARWPDGRYSTLSGFVEFGETLEECVQREVYEESGVQVRRESIRYIASQPWLFPRSLMVGFLAEASDTRLLVDENELADAQWFHRDFVAERFSRDGPVSESDTFHVPSRVSLAHCLIGRWLQETARVET